MKSLIIATGVVSALIMTGCATNSANPKPEAPHHHKEGKFHKKYHHKHSPMSQEYTCDTGATIKAQYNPNDKKANLTINAPTLGLNAQEIAFTHLNKRQWAKLHKADPASDSQHAHTPKKPHGFTFINHTNVDAKYEWQASGKDGVLTVVTPTKTHTLTCQSTTPMHDHHHGKPKGEMPKDAHHQHAM